MVSLELDSIYGKLGAASAAILLLFSLMFVGMNFFQGSLVGGTVVENSPYWCPVESDGDIDIDNIKGDCQTDSRGTISFQTGYYGGFGGISTDDDTSFWIKIESIYDGSRESVSPVSKFLIERGYIENQDDEYRNIRMDDIKWNSEIRESVEAGSTCSADIRVLSKYGEFSYEYGENGSNRDHVTYRPEGDEVDLLDEFFPEKVSVEAKDVKVGEHNVYCKFDFEEIMNKGAYGTPFHAWDGDDTPTIWGDDADEGATSLSIDFGLDDDKDGIKNNNDECPQEPGSEDNNGCPNDPSTIESVNGPESVTVTESASYSVVVQNPDGDETSISWSNGDSGNSTDYSWSSTGNKTVSVTVDDGTEANSESVSVEVVEAPEPPNPLDQLTSFFSDIWSILTFSG